MAARSSTRREPQIELRKLTEDYCEFVLKNTDVSMANALRRIILVEVCGCCCWVLVLGAAGRERGLHACCWPGRNDFDIAVAVCIWLSPQTVLHLILCLAQVPTIAVELVEFEANTTVRTATLS